MNKPYSQTTALLAITKASFKAILKHPTAIFFSIGFPLIFVWIFGSFGDGGIPTYKIALDKSVDTLHNPIVQAIKFAPVLKLVSYSNDADLKINLEKGRISAVMSIDEVKDALGKPHFNIHLKTTSASEPDLRVIEPALKAVAEGFEKMTNPSKQDLVNISTTVDKSIREYKNIDFVLPGQIGFSILFSTLFGIAFTFYGLREQLVLKRFYASPVNKLHILLGIGFSRLAFQLTSVIVLILLGKFWLGFTLVHGIATFLQMITMAILLLLVLMGVGLIFSSIAKQDSTIPLFINVFALPQMLLGGTFFPISVFPPWMQFVCKLFPLTHFNIALRKISFEGLSLIDCWQNIGVLGIWLVVVYFIVYKIFKWE